MSRIYSLLVILLALCGEINAQSWWLEKSEAKKDSAGEVIYINDARIDSLLATRVYLNKTDSTSQGYRVQIFYGSSRENANEILGQFRADYPEMKAYLLYEQPYFKVRIGDFPERLQAEKWSRQLSRKYQGAFIVSDKIFYK